jgi:hypothetical protein
MGNHLKKKRRNKNPPATAAAASVRLLVSWWWWGKSIDVGESTPLEDIVIAQLTGRIGCVCTAAAGGGTV